MKKWIVLVAIFLLAVVLVLFVSGNFFGSTSEQPLVLTPILTPQQQNEVSSFDECVEAGFPVMESYPRQCRSNGVTFIENIGNELEKNDMIRVSSPRPNELISSPVTIQGEARGSWYFEAIFPIVVYDQDGIQIGGGFVQAQGEWMTDNFVSFSGVIDFADPVGDFGVLILEKNNPSGLPQHSDELRVPIRFR